MKTSMKTAFLLAFIAFVPFLADKALATDMIIGGETTHTVAKGDNIYRVGAKYGVYWKNIARDNGLDEKQPLVEGAVLKLNNRKIVPKVVENGIIINIPDRTLYFFQAGQVMALPVGLGALLQNEFGDWKTPEGKFHITAKRKDPIWYVPESIQIEYAMKGKEVEETVPPGPKNPLGKYAITTSIPAVLIHDTIYPGSVYRYMSHGCIRMLREHIERLFPLVEIKTPGEIIYEPVKIAQTAEGRVYLEVRTDVYRKHRSLKQRAAKLFESRGISDKIDWQKVEKIIKEETGVAEDVSLGPPPKAPSAQSQSAGTSLTQRIIDYFKTKFKKNDVKKGSGIREQKRWAKPKAKTSGLRI